MFVIDHSVPIGQETQGANQLASNFQVMFGSTPATLSYWGLVAPFVGLYQFNIVVPNVPANDFTPISFTLGGVPGAQALYIAVQQSGSVVIAGLWKIDAILGSPVDQTMLLGDPSRPATGEQIFQRLGFAGASERVWQDGLDQLQYSQGDAPFGFDPVTKVLPKIRMEDRFAFNGPSQVPALFASG